MYSRFNFFVLAATILILSGCASMETLPPDAIVLTQPPPISKPKGNYHKVKKKETIYTIAKMYNVTTDDIVKSNNIPDMGKIEVDQLILIPDGASKTKVVYNESSGKKEDFAWPVKGKIVGYFNKRNNEVLSKGIDIKVTRGETVKAARSGKVVFADYLPGQSYMIIIDHQDGFHTVYSKNAKLLVKYGDVVKKADPIANVGEQQQLASLHFEIRKNKYADNPLYYLP
ncbi:MAG: peptidoglycan DD-metalloendopeptidase family protein [Candidatus Omnitrophica bacterium]|nr:peptidoglycan DD-metalloendopeptidase family protein [Candidatus Omnitrophota bacterium]